MNRRSGRRVLRAKGKMVRPFPLTPTLSLREREKHGPIGGKRFRGVNARGAWLRRILTPTLGVRIRRNEISRMEPLNPA
jgi:hypothetical protein